MKLRFSPLESTSTVAKLLDFSIRVYLRITLRTGLPFCLVTISDTTCVPGFALNQLFDRANSLMAYAGIVKCRNGRQRNIATSFAARLSGRVAMFVLTGCNTVAFNKVSDFPPILPTL